MVLLTGVRTGVIVDTDDVARTADGRYHDVDSFWEAAVPYEGVGVPDADDQPRHPAWAGLVQRAADALDASAGQVLAALAAPLVELAEKRRSVVGTGVAHAAAQAALEAVDALANSARSA